MANASGDSALVLELLYVTEIGAALAPAAMEETLENLEFLRRA